MTSDQRANLEAYAREKLDENWFIIRRASDDGSKALLLLLIHEVYADARADGLNDGHRATMDGAKQAIGTPQCALIGEAALPAHSVYEITT